MMRVHCFVDSDHASDKVTRKSQTGILIFINSSQQETKLCGILRVWLRIHCHENRCRIDTGSLSEITLVGNTLTRTR
jgi:hypothetical protein